MPPDLGTFTLLVLVIFYLSGFLHELGHAVCAHLAGLRVTSFGMGMGRPFFVVSWRGVRIYACWRRPFQGLAFCIFPQILPSRWQQVSLFSGGIVAHLMLVGMACLLLLLWPALAFVWNLLGGLNLLFAIVNLIPFQFQVGAVRFRNDGLLILNVLRSGSNLIGPGEAISILGAFRELWTATGNYHVLHTYLLMTASSHVSLGDAARGNDLLSEARSLPFEPIAPFRAYEDLVEAEIALGQEQPDGAALALAKAEERFRALGHETGLVLVSLTRATALHRGGQLAEAMQLLELLARHPLIQRHVLVRSLLLVKRLECSLDLPGAEPLIELQEYATIPARVRSAVSDAKVYHLTARWASGIGEKESAAKIYGKMLQALDTLDASLTGVHQEHFRLAHRPLIAEAQSCLRDLGREAEAARLDTFFPTPEERTRQALEKKKRRDSLMLRWGLVALVINAVVVLGLIGPRLLHLESMPADSGARLSGAAVSVRPSLAGFLLVVMLMMTTGIGILLSLLLAALGRVLKGCAGVSGTVLLFMTVFPWPVWLLIVVLDAFVIGS